MTVLPMPKSHSTPASSSVSPRRRRSKQSPSSASHASLSSSSITMSPVSMHPRSFTSDFNVIAELTDHRDKYTGREPLTLYTFPGYLATILDRIRSRVLTTSRPGLNTTIACCIANGIDTLSSHPDIQALLTLKQRLDLTDEVDADDIEELYTWFRQFPISIPDSVGSGSRRQNITLPEHLKSSVCSFASDLGTSSSALIILATMVTLSTQDCILADHQQLLERAVDTFLRRVQRRRRVAEVLIEMIEEEDLAT